MGLKHVGLASHSCGVIYLMNILYHMPEILSSESPTVYMLSPWVHPSKSGVKMLTIASAMPAGFVQSWTKVTSFLVNNLMPSLSSFSSKSKKKEEKAQKVTAKDEKMLATCGLSAAETENTRNYYIKMFFAEETSGSSEEASLGLKMSGQGHWGVCEDYEDFVASLAKKVRVDGKLSKLHIQACFGGKDSFVGKGGMKYFTETWTGKETQDIFFFEGEEVPGLDHDDVTLPENGILGKIFESSTLR